MFRVGGAYLTIDKHDYLIDSVDYDGYVSARRITGFVNDTYLQEEEGKFKRTIASPGDGRAVELPVTVSSFQRERTGDWSTVAVTINLDTGIIFDGDINSEAASTGSAESEFLSDEATLLLLTLLKGQAKGEDIVKGLSEWAVRVKGLSITRNYLGGWNLRVGGMDTSCMKLILHVHSATTP